MSTDSAAVVNRYVTASMLLLLAGGIASALGYGTSAFARAGLPVPDWRVGVLGALVFGVGLYRAVRAT